MLTNYAQKERGEMNGKTILKDEEGFFFKTGKVI